MLSVYFRAGGVAPVVKCLPSKHESRSSNPSTEKKKKAIFGNQLCFYALKGTI
jgi:hypothetical protein